MYVAGMNEITSKHFVAFPFYLKLLCKAVCIGSHLKWAKKQIKCLQPSPTRSAIRPFFFYPTNKVPALELTKYVFFFFF